MNKLIGTILLIVGTSIGGGMLALPVATAAAGFWQSSLLLIVIWAVMTMGALFLLEVNLWLPENSNLVSMAKQTLGKPAAIICWLSYLMLLYCLLSAYIAGGSDLAQQLFAKIGLHFRHWIASIIFVGVFATIVWYGIKTVDRINRGLMSVKIIAYLLLVILISPLVSPSKLVDGPSHALIGAVMVVVTSFGYAVIIPSLRTYLQSNVKQLRLAIIVGSVIPLVCYIAWDYVVQGSVNQNTLVAISHSNNVISQLSHYVSAHTHSPLITLIVHTFASICVLTAFLGVSLSLSDFLADGLKLKKSGNQKIGVYALTLPPLLIILFYPGAFIAGLKYAGIFCVIILMLLPALMAWNGRYRQKRKSSFEVFGGKMGLNITLVISVLLLIFAVFETF